MGTPRKFTHCDKSFAFYLGISSSVPTVVLILYFHRRLPSYKSYFHYNFNQSKDCQCLQASLLNIRKTQLWSTRITAQKVYIGMTNETRGLSKRHRNDRVVEMPLESKTDAQDKVLRNKIDSWYPESCVVTIQTK